MTEPYFTMRHRVAGDKILVEAVKGDEVFSFEYFVTDFDGPKGLLIAVLERVGLPKPDRIAGPDTWQ